MTMELEAFQYFMRNELADVFPNVLIAYRMHLSLLFTNCSGESSFSKLNRAEIMHAIYHGPEKTVKSCYSAC